MFRIDNVPTHTYQGFKLRPGKPLPFGASIVPGGVNFSVFSQFAFSCELVLYKKGATTPDVVIPFMDGFRIGNVFSMVVFDLDIEDLEYGYRMDGPLKPEDGHRFDKTKILLDPYARIIGGRDVWGAQPEHTLSYEHRARVAFDDFDWQGDRPLELPLEDLVIYEAHVRGLTAHKSSGVKHPGSFSSIREKIPYLKDLGINCLELMPIHEFDEFEYPRISPETGLPLLNYWGYSNVGFFAPKAGYAATGAYGMQIDELKNLIRELHKNGIEVMLDVVFNHTAEGNERGPYISYRGLDNKTYYLLTPGGDYYNFSGCGNTLNCNHPVVRNMILDCLRYWAAEFHIDGFRFDLASILGRDREGRPMGNPPLLEALAFDPVLGRCKLIAEAWDAGGLYQVGSFPSWGRWAEWNGKFRDNVRAFVKGDEGYVGAISQCIQGSPDLYGGREQGTTASINFITAHDGFTMMDQVSYNEKHNEANGEENRDGSNDNLSWNCGEEGSTDDEGIKFLRRKQVRNFMTILLLSRGVPMMVAGDEFGKTQGGNNNAYCQDNEISWIDWTLLEKNRHLYNFVKKMVAFRKTHELLRGSAHFANHDYLECGYPDISWHGVQAWQPDWNGYSRTLAFMLYGAYAGPREASIYVAMNMHWEPHEFEIPGLPPGKKWFLFADTDAPAGREIAVPGGEIYLDKQTKYKVQARSIVILLGK